MPITLTKYRIKDLPAIVQEADLINKVFEVETANGTDANSKVSIPTLVQTVANNLPGGNNSKVAVKTARCYDNTNPFYSPGDETLVGLNPDFLCLQTTCRVEFPHIEYVLVYDGTPGATLMVWRDGDFTGQKIAAKWVEVNSLEARTQSIADFSPFAASYLTGDNVKYRLNNTLRLFAAKIDLVKSTFTPQQIPAPTGLSTDANWAEINAGAGDCLVGDFLPGAYKRHEIVVFNHKLHRAKQDLVIGDFINDGAYDNFPDPDYWEIVGDGASIQNPYDDTALRTRITDAESTIDSLTTAVDNNYTEFNARLSEIHAGVRDWTGGSYAKGDLVSYNNIVFVAKQKILNSLVAPVTTNAYWLQVSGGGGVSAQNSLTPGSSTLAPTVDAVTAGLADVQSQINDTQAQVDQHQQQLNTVQLALVDKADTSQVAAVSDRVSELEAISFIDFRAESNVVGGNFTAADSSAFSITANATLVLNATKDARGVLCCLRVPPTSAPVTIAIGGAGTLDNSTTALKMQAGEWIIIRKAPSNNTTSAYYTTLRGGKVGVVQRNTTVVTFDRDSEYAPISSGTFTVDDTNKIVGCVVTAYLTPSASAPTIPTSGYKLITGSYVAGASLMYMFKVGANGIIHYTITNIS